MIFSQVYPVVFYAILLFLTLLASFLFVLKRKRKVKSLIVFSPAINENVLSTVDGIAHNFDMASYEGIENFVKEYKNCIYIIDPSKNLEEEIERLKKISTNFENFNVIAIKSKPRKIEKILKKKVYVVKRLSELKDLIPSLLK